MALRTIYPQKHHLTANGTVGGIVAIADVTQLAIGTVGVIYDVNNDPVSIAVMGIDTLNSTLTLYANGSPLDASPFTRAGLATVDFPYQMVDGSGFIPAPPPASDVLNGIVRLNRAAPVPATPVVPVFDAGGRLGGVADPVAVDDVATMGWVTGVLPAPYTLPIASALVLGGIKVGSNLSIDVDGVLSADAQIVAPYTLTGVGDTIPFTINAAIAQTAKLQSWQVDGVEKAYLDRDGFLVLGIGNGTTSGVSVFSQYNPVMFRAENRASGSSGAGAFLGLFHNTLGGGYIMQNGHRMGGFFFGGNSGDDANLRNSAGIFGFATQTWVNLTGYGSALSFAVTPNNSTTRAEKMRLDNTGFLGLGTSTPDATLHVLATQADSATSVAAHINTSTTWATSGGKLLSIQNNGSDRAWFSYNGELTVLASMFVVGGSGLWGRSIGNKIIMDSAGSVSLGSVIADGAAAVAHVLNTAPALTIAGAKLLSIKNNGSEVFYVEKSGSFRSYGTADNYIYGNVLVVTGKTISSNVYQAYAGNSSVTLKGIAQDSASAVAVILENTYTLSTTGSKLLSVRNNIVEKAYIDMDGYITSAGSPVARKVAVPASAAAAGNPGDWAADASWLYICTATDTWERTAITLATW